MRADPPGIKIVFVTPEKVAQSDKLMRLFDNLHERGLLVGFPIELKTIDPTTLLFTICNARQPVAGKRRFVHVVHACLAPAKL